MTRLKISTNMIGLSVTSSSSSGVRLMWMRLRLTISHESRSHQVAVMLGASAGSGASSAGRPVIDRKTSSRVGRRKPMSSTFTSAASSSRMARVSTPSCESIATLTRRAPSSTRTGPPPSPSSTRLAAGSHGASLMVTSRRSPPTSRFSSFAVPCAITRP
jgi:hypothetical protein